MSSKLCEFISFKTKICLPASELSVHNGLKDQFHIWEDLPGTVASSFVMAELFRAEHDWEELMGTRNAATEEMSKTKVDEVRFFSSDSSHLANCS